MITTPYIYQTIQITDGEPRLCSAHLLTLGEWAARLFDADYSPSLTDFEERIRAVARREKYPDNLSSFVRVEVDSEGQERLIPGGISLYHGYALRSISPTASIVSYDLPLCEAPTPVSEAAAQFATLKAHLAGTDIAIRSNSKGECVTADDAPLFAIRGEMVATSSTRDNVEAALARHAIESAGLQFMAEPLNEENIFEFDELFYVDHRGVTSIERCNGYLYMSLKAERIALNIENFFR